MLTMTTVVNETHDQTTVPLGAIDAFGRDDGWPDDRPADNGHFWQSAPDLPGYLTAGTLGCTPGQTFFSSRMYVGGSAVGVQFDVFNGGVGGDYWVAELLSSNSFPRFAVEQTDGNGLLLYTDAGGVDTTIDSFAGHTNGTTERWYLTAQPFGSGTWITIERSAVSGAGRVTLVQGFYSYTSAGAWIGLQGRPGYTFDNASRIAIPDLTGMVLDTFRRTNPGTGLWGTSDSGHVWRRPTALYNTGSFNITSSGVAQHNLAGTVDALLVTGLADVDITWTFTRGDTNSVLVLPFRSPDNMSSYYDLVIDAATGNVTFRRTASGTTTTVAAAGSVGTSTSTSHRVRAKMVGTAYEIYVDGTLTASGTDTLTGTGTGIGVLTFESSASTRWALTNLVAVAA